MKRGIVVPWEQSRPRSAGSVCSQGSRQLSLSRNRCDKEWTEVEPLHNTGSNTQHWPQIAL